MIYPQFNIFRSFSLDEGVIQGFINPMNSYPSIIIFERF